MAEQSRKEVTSTGPVHISTGSVLGFGANGLKSAQVIGLSSNNSRNQASIARLCQALAHVIGDQRPVMQDRHRRSNVSRMAGLLLREVQHGAALGVGP